MADVSIWEMLTAIGAAGSAGVLALLAIRIWSGIPHLMEKWLAFRIARAAEKTADWNRRGDELNRLDARCVKLEQAEQRCRDDLADAKQRIAVLEGYQIGKGQLRQELTIIDATERMEKDKP